MRSMGTMGYGVYDYWGVPKAVGIGGGLRALEETNHPVGIFMEYKDAPVALHAVNDLDTDLRERTAEWTVTKGNGERVTSGLQTVRLVPDSHLRIDGAAFDVPSDEWY